MVRNATHSSEGPPAARNPRQSRERILAAALGEFAAHGFAGARVDAIARQAGLNKRMLYHYFGDKEGLFREVLRRKLAERTTWQAATPEDPTESLPHWLEIACRDPGWIRLLEWEALQWGDGPVLEEGRRRAAFSQFRAHIRRRQRAGFLIPGLDPGQLLLSLMALAAYPVAFPQLARLATGLAVSDPRFMRQRRRFLRQFAAALRPSRRGAPAGPRGAVSRTPGRTR